MKHPAYQIFSEGGSPFGIEKIDLLGLVHMDHLFRSHLWFPDRTFRGEMVYDYDIYYSLPDGFIGIGIILSTLFGVYYSTEKAYGYPSLHRVFPFLGSFLCFGGVFLLWTTPFTTGIMWNHALYYDSLGLYFKILLLVGGMFFCALCQKNFRTLQFNNFEYISLLLCSFTSMILLTSAYDFLTIYLAIELQALCFYVCAASKKYSEFSTEAGLKYFLLGAFSSGLLLFGMAWIYGFTGMIHFSDLFLFLTLPIEKEQASPILIGFLFLFFGFFFKLTAAPFHIWAPDVYEGSPTIITAFFANFPKASLLVPFWRLFSFTRSWGEGDSLSNGILPFLMVSVFLSISIGTFGALAQRKVKRILAYSSIAHVGFLLLGFLCESLGGLQSILIYYPIYMITNGGIFGILLLPQWNRTPSFLRGSGGTSPAPTGGKYITDFAGIGKRAPILAFLFSIFFFSLAGIPPLAGFYSKAFLFFAALLSGIFFLAFFAILASVCSCFYYIRFIRIFYFEKEMEGKTLQFYPMPPQNSYLIALSFLGIVGSTLWWNPLLAYTASIVQGGPLLPPGYFYF